MTASRESVASVGLKSFEKILLGVDTGVPGAVWRMVIGATILAAQQWVFGVQSGPKYTIPLFLCALISVRFATLVARRVVRVSPEVTKIWTIRRQYAKLYDSYQWRKLFWIGLGMACYFAISGRHPIEWVILCSSCLGAGLVGIWRWELVRPK